MAEERIPSRRRARIQRSLARIRAERPEVAAWELHLARRALFGDAGPVAARRARARYIPELLAALDQRASEWKEWAMFRHDPRFRPAGMGFPLGSFFLGDVLFMNRSAESQPFLFDLDLPLLPAGHNAD
jgi:hypothetical protein